jgi:glycosyltransferase involved in cell wall biosynthesis
MASSWLYIVILIAILLLFGDAAAAVQGRLTPDKLASKSYTSWPMWKTIDVDERKRILWIDQTYVPYVNAGSEVCTHQLNKFLISKPYKWDVYVAAPNMPKRTYENVRCFDLHDHETFIQVLQHTHMIHGHQRTYRKSMIALSRITGIPFVCWPHTEQYVRQYKQKWNDPSIQGRQFTVFNSKQMRALVPIEDNTSFILFPTVNYRDYMIEDTKHERRYVTLSNVNENKGGHLLVKLAQACPELEFQGVVGGYYEQIKKKGLPNLRYVPHTDTIKDVYAQTWVQIMPSKEETWGRTAVEAMSSGIPVIVAPTPGLQECCGEAALYCDRGDVDAWVIALRQLAANQEFYNRRSAAALERARALDPLPDLDRCEVWLEKTVVPTKTIGRMPTWFEKNMLFL